MGTWNVATEMEEMNLQVTEVKKVKEKKFGEFYETEFALRQKQKQFLQYRGFYQDHIEYAVSANESS